MPRLLVVDDEPSICWALSRLGQSLGHRSGHGLVRRTGAGIGRRSSRPMPWCSTSACPAWTA